MYTNNNTRKCFYTRSILLGTNKSLLIIGVVNTVVVVSIDVVNTGGGFAVGGGCGLNMYVAIDVINKLSLKTL